MKTSWTAAMISPELNGKGAIITGGGSGINFAFLKTVRENGCAVLIGDLSLQSEAVDWLESTKSDGGPEVFFQKTEVSDWTQLERLFDVYAENFGGVPDIVVAGAGIYEASSAGFWNDRDDASHYSVIDVNLLHPIKLTRIAIRRLRQAKKPGVIIHESSIVALRPSIVLPLYAITKAALSHFVRCMAPLHEMSGIKVVAVAPGLVDTQLFRQHPEAQQHVNLGKEFFLPPEEVVKAMIAVTTDARYRAGTVLEVNDIGSWREVQLLNDPGPQGQSRRPRQKAADAIVHVEKALEEDGKGFLEYRRRWKL